MSVCVSNLKRDLDETSEESVTITVFRRDLSELIEILENAVELLLEEVRK